MKVLLAHKFLHMTGGTEKYFRDLAAILEDNGHSIIPFALKHSNNPDSPYEKYFLDNLDYRDKSMKYQLRYLFRILGRTLYSWEARRKVETLIRDVKPDIAHIQSIEHHISPSILHSFRKYNLPIVQSVNTYKLVCASYRLYLLDRQELCQRCLYGKHYHAVETRCVKGSLSASFLAMVEMYLHQLMQIYHLVDRFIVPNNFIASRLIGAGYPANKIVKLLNPFKIDDCEPCYEADDYILYFGRIDPEKGVMTLVQAMQKLVGLKLIIVGNGTQMEDIQNWVHSQRLDNIEFVGPKWGKNLTPYLARARLVLVPSVWHEPSPYVIYQSLASGKPVIGANIGGIPDLITPETGLIFQPGDVTDLVEKIEGIAFDKNRLKIMGRAARQWAETNLAIEGFYDNLLTLYGQLIDEKRAM